MAKYWLEVIGAHGNYHEDGKATLTETRKQACRIIGKKDITVNIFQTVDGFYKHIDTIWYDKAWSGAYGNYSHTSAGYWVQHRTGDKKRRKLSAKTGKPMALNKYRDYL